MICEYVSKVYGVPACIGRRVTVGGRPGVIADDRGHYIGVNFDEHKPGDIRNAHPISEVVFLGMGKVRKPTRSQSRYQRFLDADTGMSFIAWLRCLKGHNQ